MSKKCFEKKSIAEGGAKKATTKEKNGFF